MFFTQSALSPPPESRNSRRPWIANQISMRCARPLRRPMVVRYAKSTSARRSNTLRQGTQFVNGAPHPNAAKVFINWGLTERGQLFWRDLGQFPLNSAIEPTEDWMKGVNSAKQVYENLMDAKAQQSSYDAATKDFKK
jgi:hypothetical protein